MGVTSGPPGRSPRPVHPLCSSPDSGPRHFQTCWRSSSLSHSGSSTRMGGQSVSQSYLTLCDPTDCSPPGSSIHGIVQVRIQEQVCHSLLQGIFPTLGLNPGLLHCRQILYQLNQDGKIHLNVLAPAESQSCFPSPVFFETLFPEEQRSNSSPAPPPTDSEQSPNTPAVSSLRFLHLQPAPRNSCSAWGSPDAALDPELVLQQ